MDMSSPCALQGGRVSTQRAQSGEPSPSMSVPGQLLGEGAGGTLQGSSATGMHVRYMQVEVQRRRDQFGFPARITLPELTVMTE